MRKINRVVVHCSATPVSLDIGAKEIREWHKNKGWKDIGYNYVIRRDGTLEGGRDLDKDGDYEEEIGAHAEGFNKDSIGVCLIGGVNKNNKAEANFTFSQYACLINLLKDIFGRHGAVEVLGHKDLPGVSKDCPSFNVKAFFGMA